MNFYEQEAAEEQKQRQYHEQKCRCFTCGEFLLWDEAQAAHRIHKAKWLLKKYGAEVMHHRFNIRITHSGDCNSAVMIMPESLPALKLISEIMEDLECH
jgi:hypothetical protein